MSAGTIVFKHKDHILKKHWLWRFFFISLKNIIIRPLRKIHAFTEGGRKKLFNSNDLKQKPKMNLIEYFFSCIMWKYIVNAM